MRKFGFLLALLSVLFLSAISFAQQAPGPLQTITLNDGSVLKGSLESVEGEYYVIQTQKLGTLRIHRADLKSMNTGSTASAPCPLPQGTLPGMGDFNQLQQQLLSDPGILNMVTELASDPEMVQLLSNPSLIPLLMNMNPSEVQDDPTIQELMANPKMKRLMETISQKMGIGSMNGSTSLPTLQTLK